MMVPHSWAEMDATNKIEARRKTNALILKTTRQLFRTTTELLNLLQTENFRM
jgi:hypothetical protein